MKTKKRKLIFLLFLAIGMISFNLSLPFFNSVFLPNSMPNGDMFSEEDESTLDFEVPTTSEYQHFEGDGENLNITLHQSLVNTSTIEFPNLDNANSFSQPFPDFSGYNTSFLNISIDNIYAPNKTINLELGTSFNDQILTDLFAYSFTVRNTCIIQNFSIYLSESGGSGGNVDIKFLIFNATFSLSNSRIEPDTNTGLIDITQTVFDEDTGKWYNFSINKQLDISNTYNNTFFIYFYQNTNINFARGYYHYQTGSTEDDYLVYRNSGIGWQELARDISSQVIVGLSDNTPRPSDINLRVNNISVSDIDANNQGYWSSTEEFEGYNGNIDFEITADWWNVSCDVTRVQLNYTKTDVQSLSDFSIGSSGANVYWNVTVPGGLNYFDSRIDDFNTINFTIPRIWNDASIRVFNGATEITTLVKRQIDEIYREVQVLNANNGTYWYLNATSSNLLTSIDTFVESIPRMMVNHSNTVTVNTSFSETVFNGILNLSIFSPLPRYLNHTRVFELTTPNDEFFVSDWDVSVNVTQYGVFKIQMSWNNDTAAGFLEEYVTVIADTDLILSLPKSTFDSGESFDLTVFYNDTGQDEGIDADTINYQIGSGSIRTDNITPLGNGYYEISIDCNDTDFINYGMNTITVFTYKQFYNNQSRSTSFTILAETEATILYPSDNALFNSGDTFDLKIFYNNTIKNTGITGATIQYSLNEGASYRSDGVNPLGGGEYNITIDAADAQFGGYGFKQIIVNISLMYYYNQSESLTIQILGETSITAERVPDKAYYNSAETFNISVFYRDTAKDIGISGANIAVDVDGTPFSPLWFDYGGGNYEIEIDCSDAIFRPYNTNAIRVNISLANYYNQTRTLNTIIAGNTSLVTIAPSSGAVFIQDQSFQITVEYMDTILSSGIEGATIDYSLNEGSTYKQTGVIYLGSGQYNISIDVNDSDFTKYGFVDIFINASKTFYENRSITFTFHRQIKTQISPSNTANLGTVMKGLNVSYTFDYEELYLSNYITQANWNQLSAPVGFTAYLQSFANGTYTMHLDTTNVIVTGIPYVFEFSIYAIGNETQIIQLTVDVLVIQTEIVNVSWDAEIARNSGLNQSVRFYFNDTTNNDYVPNVETSDIFVRNYDTGTLFSASEYWLYDYWGNGTYILEITMGTRTSGWYTLQINASRFPNYNWSLYYITFYYRGNNTQANLVSLSDPSGTLSPVGFHNYSIFEGSDTSIVFNLTDTEYFDALVLGDADAYTISYTNLATSATGTFSADLHFISQVHTGTLFTSNLNLSPGRYQINITISKTNYEDGTLLFNLTVIERYQVILTVIYQPTEVNAGTEFNITIRAEYYNGTNWIPLTGAATRIIPYFNDVARPVIGPFLTNSTGEVVFDITIDITATRMNLTILLDSRYFHQETTIMISDIEVIPFSPGLSLEDLLPYLIIGAIMLLAVVGSVAVYRGVVVPKKREKQRVLTEVKTIFDDAINLEHILVLYKATGTCIFFKSYGSEEIDPELISGFLTAVSSFGKEMVAQEALNEISYGDKMLLLADGEYVRVALVLGKKGSLILRTHLKQFIDRFEFVYRNVLPNWRGQLAHFRNAGEIVDDLLNTSIILPHQISYDFSSLKDLKSPHSKEVLKVAHTCCEETERKFFFIATLLQEAAEHTNKDTAEIFMGIKELRDKKILIPIEISAIEAVPISQQEINLINQKVEQLTNLTTEEKQKLVTDLAQLGPAEREAYLSSLTESAKIVSAPIKTTIGTVEVTNKKSAKKEMKKLMKIAKSAKSKGDYSESLESLRTGAMIASNWDFSNEFMNLQEQIRKLQIEDLKIKKKEAEKAAKVAVKQKIYGEAATNYKTASKIASEIFKLGDPSMTKEVKRLTNKANEYDKLK